MQYTNQSLFVDFGNAKSLITSSKSTERSMSASMHSRDRESNLSWAIVAVYGFLILVSCENDRYEGKEKCGMQYLHGVSKKVSSMFFSKLGHEHVTKLLFNHSLFPFYSRLNLTLTGWLEQVRPHARLTCPGVYFSSEIITKALRSFETGCDEV